MHTVLLKEFKEEVEVTTIVPSYENRSITESLIDFIPEKHRKEQINIT